MYPTTPSALYPTPDRVQCDYRVSHAMCAEEGCTTLVAWYEHGQEDALGKFRAESCVCDYPTACCTEHAPHHVCEDCEPSADAEKRQKKSDQ